jgi:ribosomal protein S18 acetylase RimI-like enzyme
MVRPLTRADRPRVLDIIGATGMFTPDETAVALELVDIYLDQPKQRDYRLVVVEDAAGRVAGYLSYGPTPLTEGTYDLYWMAVASDAQGRGFGRELVGWLEKQVGGSGGRLILIETSSQPKYEQTRKFYLGLGYEEASRIPEFYKAGDSRITYVKYFG